MSSPESVSSPSAGNWELPSAVELDRMLPQYEIVDILGRGGMGAVFKGRQANLDRDVAIKVLCKSAIKSNADVNPIERFKQEARVMAQFDHPAIISVFDFGETSDGQFYLVMEFIDGMDIHHYLQHHGGQLSQEYSLSITAHVLDGLGYAHSRGIIHRDIKPANILLNQEGRVKITDFGLMKRFSEGEDSTSHDLETTGFTVGTPYFLAPESVNSKNKLDHRADLYSVGVMLYQMLTGNLPQGSFKLPSELRPELDIRLDKLVQHAMEPDPEQRYGSAETFRADIDQIVSQPIPLIEPGAEEADVPLTAPPPVLTLPAINLSLPALKIPLPRFGSGKKSGKQAEGNLFRRFYELGVLLTLAVVVIVLSIGFVKLNFAAKVSKTENLCHHLATAVRMYSGEYGDFPSGTQPHIADVLRGKNPKSIVFIKKTDIQSSGPFLDAWGNPVVYDFSTPMAPMIISSGPDGIGGNSDDITN